MPDDCFWNTSSVLGLPYVHCVYPEQGVHVEFPVTVAPVAFPILGPDFLNNFKLLVDLSNKRLVACGGKIIPFQLGSPSQQPW